MKYRICEMLNDKFNVQVEYKGEWRTDYDITLAKRAAFVTSLSNLDAPNAIFSSYQEAIEYLNSKKKAAEAYAKFQEELEKGKVVVKVLDEMEF